MAANDYWQVPQIEKVYEAITVLADKRLEMNADGLSGKVYSSRGDKYYIVAFDPVRRAIKSDDNQARFQGKLSYPMMALLMKVGELKYSDKLLTPLRGVVWKDLNTKHKNDYAAAVAEVLQNLKDEGVNTEEVEKGVQTIYAQVKELKLLKFTAKG
jgi:hypothetical protein